jgi:myo-inositol-1(or 4)-monophosphatase
MADYDLQEIHDFMISIARKAAPMIVSAHPTTEAAGSKKNCNVPIEPQKSVHPQF